MVASDSMHPLAGVAQKLRRADVHIVALYHEIIAYTNADLYSISAHRDLGNGKAGYRFHVNTEPPLHIATIIGDAVHNLRCALDYMAHEIVLAGGGVPGRQTMFPVSLSEADFSHQAMGLNKLRGASVGAIKLCSVCQPYRIRESMREGHPLWQLVKLSNQDKHHALALCATGGFAKTQFIHPDGRQFTSEFNDGLIQDGAVVAALPPDAFDEKIKTQFEITTHVAFKDAPLTNHEALAVVQNIRQFIGEMILPAIEKELFVRLPDELRVNPEGELHKIIEPLSG